MSNQANELRSILDDANDYIFTKDLDGCYTYVNQKVAKLFGLPANQIIGQDDSRFFSLEQSNDLRVNDQLVMSEGIESISEERNIIAKTGETRFYRAEKKPLKDSNGNIIGLFGISTDITAEKEIKEALAESEQRFKTIFEQAPLGIAVIDSLSGDIYEANPAFESIAGRSVQELRTLDWMEITHPDDIQKDLDNMAEMNAGKTSGFTMEKRYIQPDGNVNWINMTIAPMQVKDKNKPRHLCMTEDINVRKAAEEKLIFMAHYDELTKLPNRTLFTDRFKQAVAHSKRNESMIGLCFIDLDNFKPVNDNYGHEVGDKVLIEVATRLKANLRGEDSASRLGGDEFCLLLGDIESLAECELLLSRLIDGLDQPYTIDKCIHKISVSIGVTLYPLDNADFDTLLRHADQAMYQAKLEGKDKYVLFNTTQATMKNMS